MANFGEAIKKVLQWEGGFVNDPYDPGGATNWGLSKKFLDRIGNYSIGEIESMTEESAVKIYRQEIWLKRGYDKIKSDELATKVFNIGVNISDSSAIKILQQSYNQVFKDNKIKVDGILGPETLGAVNCLSAVKIDEITRAFKMRCVKHYEKWCKGNPNRKEFAAGLIARANA